MKRIAILLLALCLLLPACGRLVPDPVPETTTTETPAIQPPITELSWRVISTDAAMKADIAAWRDEDPYALYRQDELKISEDKMVIMKIKMNQDQDDRVSSTILLRNEADGSETVLLEHPSGYERFRTYPNLGYVLDKRYFVIHWNYYEGSAGCSVYDLQEKRNIPIQFPAGSLGPRFLAYIDGYLYFEHSAYSYEPGDPLHITRVALDALLADNNLPAADVIVDTQVGRTGHAMLSPGGRYLAAVASPQEAEPVDTLLVYDLAQQERVLHLPQPEGHSFISSHFADDHTLYFYDHTDDGNVLEITLP